MSALLGLRRGIQRQLHQLVSSAKIDVLHKLAGSVKNEVEEDLPGDDATEVELYDFLVDFLKSDKLEGEEDQGMSRLLVFNDLITELQRPAEAVDEECGFMAETESAAASSVVSPRVDRSSVVANQVTDMIKLSDVASLLPRREFKIHSGQISDSDSDVSYSTLCRQIDEGLVEGFTEAEVIRTVLRIIKPGTFKDMLMTKHRLTVAELKRFLRAHLRDKSSAELFQELSNTKQQDKESPQQFMYRLMGLKQRVLSASQHSSSEFQYGDKLVQGMFLHSLYQGISEKYAYVRRDLKPVISNMSVADDFILEIITKAVTEEVERQACIGQTHRTKTVTVTLLVSNVKRLGPSGQPPPGPALLVPEFCYMTGLTDKMRNDYNIMKDLASHTRLTPEQRESRLSRFIGNIHRSADVQKELGNWGLNFDSKLLELRARVLPAERIMRGSRTYEYNPWAADWSKEMRGLSLINSRPLENWMMFYTPRNYEQAQALLQTLGRVSGPLGIRLQRAVMIEYEDKQESLLRALQ